MQPQHPITVQTNTAMRFLLFIVALCFVSVITIAQPMPNDVGVSGVVKPKTKPVKPAKIKYKFHNGTAILKSGLLLTGKFKYLPPKGADVPQFSFVDAETSEKKMVALSMIDKLVLEGSEPGITFRPDSTEFVWIDKYRDLYRKVRGGVVELYDNSRVVNEPYEYLTDYLLIAGRQDYGHKLIRKLSDIEIMMSDRPYFIESAKITNRYETQDFRVIVYLVDLYNDTNPMRVLKWDEVTLQLKNNQLLYGRGYIQPLDMRNEYIESTSAYVHFYDGKDFRLISSRDIKEIVVNGEAYIGGVYTITNKFFYGKKWVFQGNEYAIVQRLTNTNNYFFKSRSYNEGIVILKKMGEAYIKPVEETELRRAYLETLKTTSSAQ
ncbi:hypothetical protein C7N43_28635 [Sphingobacteriales bacterium UPWRP_1]|nr:hypothetical protein BVG80_12370 [Sphingobacteriales bacterium TSM_CSM]PSJ73539.1 hypothetical protein C7N43_28635 [Sphingobacteriales bacterium UPWRP_1]